MTKKSQEGHNQKNLTNKMAGSTFAQAMQLGIEYDPEPPFDVGSPKKVSLATLESLTIKRRASFEKEWS